MTDHQQTGGCFGKLLGPVQNFVSKCATGHPIYPAEPVAPNHSEYLLVKHHQRLRVIHIKSDEAINITGEQEKRRSTNRNSLSEEYWFTRWNKPLLLDNCRCSFKRLQRYSLLSNKGYSNCLPNKRTLKTYSLPSVKIANVDTFVERLVEETLFAALNELQVQQNALSTSLETGGTVNLGYSGEVDDTVVRKRLSIDKDLICDKTSVTNTCKSNMHREKATASCSHGKLGSTSKVPKLVFTNVTN